MVHRRRAGGPSPALRATVRAAAIALVLSWAYAGAYALGRERVHALLPERAPFGRRQVDADEADLLATALDWSLVLWVVLPVALLACTLAVAHVGVGHIALLVTAVASAPVLTLFGAWFPMDPVLAALALAHGVAVVVVVVRFLRALGSS